MFSIQGQWKAERYELASFKLPVGPGITIKEREFETFGQVVPIASVESTGSKVILNVPTGLGVEVGLTFIFEGKDRMYFDVPFVGKLYYNRTPDSPSQIASEKPTVKPASTLMDDRSQAANMTNSAQTSVLTADHESKGRNSMTERNLPEMRDKAPVIEGNSAVNVAPVVSMQRATKINDALVVLNLVRTGVEKLTAGDLVGSEKALLTAKTTDKLHPLVDYNLAVLRVKQNRNDDALHHLDDAFKNGLKAISLVKADTDLSPIRSDPRYLALLAKYE